jgi:hypothetical protein
VLTLGNAQSMQVITETGKRCRLLINVTTEKAAAFKLLGVTLLDREAAIVDVKEPKRGQRGYKPKEEDYIVKKRPEKKLIRRKCEYLKLILAMKAPLCQDSPP